MIQTTGKYYLYRHVRLDTNEPFYIGIGTKIGKCRTEKCNYSRAFSRYNRTLLWKNVTNKTDYEVEIILESDDYKFIKQKEIEFIALYGRRDLDLGILVNMTDGGDGMLGATGKYNGMSLQVFVYDYSGNFIRSYDSILLAEKDLNISRVCISICIKNNTHQNLEFMFFGEFRGEKISPQKKFLRNHYSKKKVTVLHLNGDVFKTFESITETANYFKTGRDTITDNCNKEIKTVYRKYYLCYSKDLYDIKLRAPGIRVLNRLKMESDNQENEVPEQES